MTIDTLRGLLEQSKGDKLTSAEAAEVEAALQQQGWTGGDVSNELAGPIVSDAQQRFAQTTTPPPTPPPNTQSGNPLGGVGYIPRPPEAPGNPVGGVGYVPRVGELPPEYNTPKPIPEPAPEPTPTPNPTPTPTPTPGGPNPLPPDPSDRVGEIVNRIPGSFYTPPDRFNYPDFVGPAFQIPDFEAPSPFQYADYAPISGDEALKQDPGYALRSSEGIRAMRNVASADGVGKSVGTLKGLMQFAGSLASQEYGAADARNFRNWQTGRQAAESDYDRLWRNKLTDYGLKYGEQNDTYDRALTAYDTNLKTRATGQGFDLDAAAGMAGGRQGATSLAGNLTLGQGNLDLGRDQLGVNRQVSLGNLGISQGTLDLNRSNSRFQNLLDLYRLSTQNLPNMPTSEASFL